MSVDLAPWLMGLAGAGMGAGILVYCARGLRRSRIRSLIRNRRDDPYHRGLHPKRFWVSLIYNGVVGSIFLLGGLLMPVAERVSAREKPFRDDCVAGKAGRPPADTIAACERWLQSVRTGTFDRGLAWSAQADARAQLGDEAEATRLRRAAIGAYGHSQSGYPADSVAHWNSAKLMVQLGDFAQAEGALLSYVAIEPERGDGWLELGMVDLRLQKLQQAIVHLTRASERLPGEARPLAARGMAYLLAGDRVRAAADIEAARKMDAAEPLVAEADRLFAAGPVAPITSRTQP